MSLSDLKLSIKSLEKNLALIKKEITNDINQDFLKLIKETKEHKQWYNDGKCYKCGGSVYPRDSGNLGSIWRCKACHKDVYDDALHDYYFEPIIKKILKLAEEMSL